MQNRTTILKKNYYQPLFNAVKKYMTLHNSWSPNMTTLTLFTLCESVLDGDLTLLPEIFEHVRFDGGFTLNFDFPSAVRGALFSNASFKPVFPNDCDHPSPYLQRAKYKSLLALTYTDLVCKDIMQIVMSHDDMFTAATVFRVFYENSTSEKVEVLALLLKNFLLDIKFLDKIYKNLNPIFEIWRSYGHVVNENDVASIISVNNRYIPSVVLFTFNKIPPHLRTHSIFEQICKTLAAYELAKFTALITNATYTEIVMTFYPLLPIYRNQIINGKDEIVTVQNHSPLTFNCVLLILKYYPTPLPYEMREILLTALQEHINSITFKYKEGIRYSDVVKNNRFIQSTVLFQPASNLSTLPQVKKPTLLPPPTSTAVTNAPPTDTVSTKKKKRKKPYSTGMLTFQPKKEVIAVSNRFSLLLKN